LQSAIKAILLFGRVTEVFLGPCVSLYGCPYQVGSVLVKPEVFKQATKTHFVDFDDDRWVLPTLNNKKWMGSDFGQFQSLTLASWSRVN